MTWTHPRCKSTQTLSINQTLIDPSTMPFLNATLGKDTLNSWLSFKTTDHEALRTKKLETLSEK